MKRFTKLLFLFTLIGVLSGGCELLQNSVKFNEDYSVTFTINPSGEDLTQWFIEQNVTTNIQQLLEDEGLSTDKLRSATLIEVRAELESGSEEKNFDKVIDGEIYLQYGSGDPFKAAWWPTATPAAGSTVVNLVHNSTDLKDMLLQNSFNAGGWITLNAPTMGVSYVTVYFVFELDGKLLGKA
jgi:hypothetical protein